MPACPNCTSDATETFYDVPRAPSHSCLLMDSADEARAFPAAPLRLALCDDCGFVFNAVYDASLQAYSTAYEETQHCSAHFSAFARSLAERWVDNFGLRGKRLLEIGCGKGEFLELMCRIGDNRGIGVDPSVIPERLSDETRSRIDFHREYYGPQHRDLHADAILCRHTLEHIPQTRRFLTELRSTLDDGADTLLLFELPDTKRVLREGAFWDIYYEHCSYFTAGSLAQLFRQTGFGVLELERVYDEQYLILAARPAAGPTRPTLPIEDDLESTKQAVQDFRRSIDAIQSRWRRRVSELASRGRTIAWGSGSKCVAFLTTLGLDAEIDYVVDINPHKHGKFMPGSGHRICGPDEARSAPPEAVVIMNPVYRDEIRRSLAERGCEPELYCLGVD